MMLYLALLIVPLILGFWAQRKVTGTFAKWSQVRSSAGRSGAEVARAILDRNGLQDVEVLHTPGQLTDHYDPRNRTVNLSDDVFGSNSVAAISVAAHEVGHAIQHQKSYAPLAIRSALFPAAQFGSTAFMPLFIVGILLAMAGAAFGSTMILIAIIAYSFAVLFQLVTLPVEFDASKRAKNQLRELALAPAGGPEAEGTSAVLSSAALTYVAAALASLAQLAYFVLQYMGTQR
jgi:Zn-dependent membrane protease YugP